MTVDHLGAQFDAIELRRRLAADSRKAARDLPRIDVPMVLGKPRPGMKTPEILTRASNRSVNAANKAKIKQVALVKEQREAIRIELIRSMPRSASAETLARASSTAMIDRHMEAKRKSSRTEKEVSKSNIAISPGTTAHGALK